VQNTPELARDPTHMVNASMTYEAPGGNWEVVVGGTNLTDERFIVTGVNQGGIQIIYGSYNRPREWFATLRIRS
jgi:iron complex outermembrane receptor protein